MIASSVHEVVVSVIVMVYIPDGTPEKTFPAKLIDAGFGLILYEYVPVPPEAVTVIIPSSSLQVGNAVTSGINSKTGAISMETKFPQPFTSRICTVCVPEFKFEMVVEI